MNLNYNFMIVNFLINKKILLIMIRLFFFCIFVPFFNSIYFNKKIKFLFFYLISYLINFFVFLHSKNHEKIDIFLLFLNQIFIGCLMGLIVQCIFSSIFLIGEIISSLLGLSFFTIFEKDVSSNSLFLSRFLNIVVILFFLSFNGHILFLQMFIKSFQLLPLKLCFLNYNYIFSIVKFSSFIFSYSLLISIYFLFPILMLHILFFLFMRIMPDIFFVSCSVPIFFLLGMFLLIFFLPVIKIYLIYFLKKSLFFVIFFLKKFKIFI